MKLGPSAFLREEGEGRGNAVFADVILCGPRERGRTIVEMTLLCSKQWEKGGKDTEREREREESVIGKL